MRLLLCLVAATALSCTAKSPGPAAPNAKPLATNDATLALMDQVGDRVALVLTVDLGAWGSLHGALTQLLAGAPQEVQRGFSMGQDPLRLAQLFFGLAESPKLTGLDRTRPIVVGMGEVDDSPMGSVALAVLDGEPIPGLIHRAVLPATDANALSTALEAQLRGLGAKSIQVEQGTGWLWPGRPRMRLVVVPREGHVQVVLESESTIEFDTAPVWSPPLTVTAPERTPAYLAAAAEPHAIAAVVRPRRFRAAGAAAGGVQVVRALAQVSNEYRSRLFAKGLQIVMSCEAMMSDEGLEFADHMIAVRGGEGRVRIRTVTTPTALGDRAIAAGAKGAQPPLRVLGAPLAESWLSLNVRALLDAVPTPAAFAGDERPGRALRSIQECGVWGNAYFALGGPLGLLRALEGTARAKDPKLPRLPATVQVALLQSRPPQWAVAVDLPTADDASAYQALVAQAPPGALRFATQTVGGRTRAMFGFGVEPTEVFANEAAAHNGVGGSNARPSSLNVGDPVADAVLAAIGSVEARTWRSGTSLVSALVIATSGGTADPKPLAVSGVEWKPSAPKTSPGAACLTRAVMLTSRALDAVGAVAPDMFGTVIGKALGELEPDLVCAQNDPATRPVALGARRVLLGPARDELARQWRHDQLATLLQTQCAASKLPEFCEAVAPAKALAGFELPAVRRTCGDSRQERVGHADVRVVLYDSDVSVQGEQMGLEGTADEAAVTAAIKAELDAARSQEDVGLRFDEAPDGDAQRAFGTVEVAVGPDASAAAFDRLQTALRNAEPTRVVYPVKGKSGAVRWAQLDVFDVGSDGAAQPTGAIAKIKGFQDDDLVLAVKSVGTSARARAGRPLPTVADAGDKHPLRIEAPESRVFVVADPGLQSAQRLVVEAGSVCGWVVLARPDELLGRSDHLDAPAQGVLRELDDERPAAVAGPHDPVNGLGKQQILNVVRAHSAKYRHCYEQVLQRTPTASGTLLARLSVTGEGTVSAVAFDKDTIGQPGMAACMKSALAGMKFPPAASTSVIRYPFTFKPAD